ncbi:hypothetical protein MPTK1_8g10350 [Marchantia polymorpha subsp. ruderalis]|uniref:Uncharacterized protein n=1 Tax=Marchantia polymorpha TaxID=3197 RepID=A0A2R6XN31_MARPO|nr:hypothetical protein MARPO_0008s0187 [Marchantia polymorpha]BBN19396.1 hypothetical protein Mp_8g10350 [Marchantia polymorpha subsp. ruderalis]|eukprot:PTQ47436.1 hypothetical protein MARPO_0008s0187 [Marchantia polymorpha]
MDQAKASYYRPKRLPANEDRIYKFRLYEDSLKERLQGVKEYQHIMRNAEFAHSFDAKRKFKETQAIVQTMQAHSEKSTITRKQKLAALLDGEESFLIDELKTVAMTLPERRAWLDARARALKANRMEEKDKYAEDMLFKAWRENNDDCRLHDSKMAVRRAVEGRKAQIQVLEKMKEDEEEKAKFFQKQIEREEAKQDARFYKEQAQKEATKQEAIQLLNEQRLLVEKLREEDKRTAKRQMAEMTQRWKEETEALKMEMDENKQLFRQRARHTQQYNEANKGMKQHNIDQEKAQDRDRLAKNLEKEAADQLAEEELKASHRREARDYAAHLRNMMNRQKADDLAADAVFKAKEDEEWDKREAVWKKNEDARQRLWCRVHEERQLQIAEMEANRKAMEAERRAEAEAHAAELRAMEEERQIRAMDERLTKQELLEALESQIRGKKAQTIAVQEQKREEYEHTKKTEENYEENLKKVMAALPFPEPFYGRKTTQWYEP